MENRFNNNRDFEHFVKQNADQYRMFPSEKVWKGIHNTLHTRRRWYGIGLGLLILTTGAVSWVMLSNSGKNRQVISAIPKTIIQQPATEIKQKPAVVIAPAKIVPVNKISFIASASAIQQDLFIADKAVATGVANTTVTNTIIEAPVIAYNDPGSLIKAEMANQPEAVAIKTSPVPRQVIDNSPVNTSFSTVRAQDYSFIPVKTNTVTKESASIAEERSTRDKNDIYPLSIESVVNSFIQIQKKRKTSLQVYFTPTISYRALKENKAFINSAQNVVNGTPSNNNYYTDINSIVTHKPDIGLQMGFSAGFPLTKNLKFIGGLQFNVSKYDILAFSYPGEVATIALSNPYGGTNTVSTLTNYRNAGGYKADWLHNLYFSAAIPLGLELKLMGKRKTYVGVSGTVQPTYTLSNRAYLLSTDYKNYAEIPSLTRKWNINTGFEMFAGYSTGKLNWRIGPQVRYQVMSSFVKKYPVQEHLFDFGLKLGLMLK